MAKERNSLGCLGVYFGITLVVLIAALVILFSELQETRPAAYVFLGIF